MSRRYTPQQKADALSRLQANNGNIALTHLHTGVPERTLRHWRRQNWLDAYLPLPPPTPSQRRQQELPEFKEYADALKFLRENILQELLHLSAAWSDDLMFTTPYQRVLVLSQLLDRVFKLDAHIPSQDTAQRIIIQYQDPDGSIHNTPPWARQYEDTYDPEQPGKPPWMDWQNRTPEELEALKQHKMELARKTFGISDEWRDYATTLRGDGQLQDELRPGGAALHTDQTALAFHDRLDDGES